MPPRKSPEKVPELVTFGRRLRELRKAKGWSQERLAEEADINVVQLSHLENGHNEAKLRTILKLARGLSVRTEELFRPFDKRR
ncbi:MAG TPA: helix-turn-helix transcriptional regulator [Thermoanaerobaculia bacterium]|nr:helix-turn-helix transcriptional regulator [Thermoanaerobaculia bacterium]